MDENKEMEINEQNILIEHIKENALNEFLNAKGVLQYRECLYNILINQIEAHATSEYRKSKGELRYGQCLFNATSIFAPEVANVIRGTDNDPFHQDVKIIKFFRKFEEILLDKK